MLHFVLFFNMKNWQLHNNQGLGSALFQCTNCNTNNVLMGMEKNMVLSFFGQDRRPCHLELPLSITVVVGRFMVLSFMLSLILLLVTLMGNTQHSYQFYQKSKLYKIISK